MKKYNYIYITSNLINGKIYVGKHSTNNPDDGYIGSGTIFKKALSKYGKSNFKCEILAYADTQEKLDYLERFYIRKFHSQNPSKGYNLASGGDGLLCPTYSTLLKMSISHLGNRQSEEAKRKISETEKGRIFSDEHKAKISATKRGHTVSEETRLKISNTLKERNANKKSKIQNNSF